MATDVLQPGYMRPRTSFDQRLAEIGVLSVPGDLVLNDGEARGIQRFFADLLGELIERVVHGRWRGTVGGRPSLTFRKARRARLST